MKKNKLLVSAIVLAALASCTKESTLDPTIEIAMSTQSEISFTTYASSAATTKGTPVNSNSTFQGYGEDEDYVAGSFNVTALVSGCDLELVYNTTTDDEGNDTTDGAEKAIDYTMTPELGAAVKYFNFSTVQYSSDNDKWENQNKMYWPNSSKVMHFAAYSPSSAVITGDSFAYTAESGENGITDDYTYSFAYTVTDVIGKQVDLMYAMTQVNYVAPSDQENYDKTSYITTGVDDTDLFGDTNDEDAVNLHFKHALTQIAFTATKDAELDVYVKSITICNVYNSGTFTAEALTDDEDTSESLTDSSTVGDTNDNGDLVNAGNFGSWDKSFNEETGWGTEGVDYTIVDNGVNTFYYTTGSGNGHASMSNYEATLDIKDGESSIEIISSSVATPLTSSDDVLMLMPQTLTAWIPTTSTALNCIGYHATDNSKDISDIEEYYNPTNDALKAYASSTSSASVSYLAIDCKIYHAGIDDEDAWIHDGYIFIPFDTKNINYTDAVVDNKETTNTNAWLPGYKITYCLNFGGGYIVEEGDHGIETIPDPGCIPDTDTYTLRTVTYTATVDNWIPVTAETIELGDYDTSDSSNE